jgi:DNA adenine methylase
MVTKAPKAPAKEGVKPYARPHAPVVKWAGGKRQLLAEIEPFLPKHIGTYYEPFCGGAALFFHLAGQTPRPFEKAVLCDQNEELIALYRSLRDDADALIAELGHYTNDKDLFLRVRALDPKCLTTVQRGARLLFLNRTCYNGLWRVNSKNIFNVPFGRYARPKILDAPRLLKAAEVLQGVDLRCADFLTVTTAAKPGDFVYFDPPYVAASDTADFTTYGPIGFLHADQVRLRDELLRLGNAGVKSLLSNADTAESRALYEGMQIKSIVARRRISRVGDQRNSVSELLVRPSTKHTTAGQTTSKPSPP